MRFILTTALKIRPVNLTDWQIAFEINSTLVQNM